MSGIAIVCDVCGESFGAGYHWSEVVRLQNDARDLGWTGPLTRDSKEDHCPNCTKLAQPQKSD